MMSYKNRKTSSTIFIWLHTFASFGLWGPFKLSYIKPSYIELSVLQLTLHRGRAAPLAHFCRPSALLKLPIGIFHFQTSNPTFRENFIQIRPKFKKLSIFTVNHSGLIQQISNWLYFSYFSQKTAFDILCILFPMETICMKCLILFSGKNKKNSRSSDENFTQSWYWAWHMVSSFLYDRAECALSGTPLPWNPSWSTDEGDNCIQICHLGR